MREVVGAAYEVSNVLGAGFLEKVYERALVRLEFAGIENGVAGYFPVLYKGQRAGTYIADVVVEDQVLVELKCVECFSGAQVAQCINYLKASGLRPGVLFNFQNRKVEWKRIVYG